MARIVHQRRSVVLVPQTPEEMALVEHADHQGGIVLLEEAAYPVRQQQVILPQGIFPGAAQRVALAFSRAAQRHVQAQARRGRFHLV